MLFFLRNTKADSSANTPSPAVAVVFSPVLANCLSPVATVWEVFWATVFSTSTFLFSLLSTWPKMFCAVASASSFTFCSLLNSLIFNAGNSSWTKASPLLDCFSISKAGNSGWVGASFSSVPTGLVESVDGVTGTGVFWFEAIVLLKIVYLLKWLVKNVSFPSL